MPDTARGASPANEISGQDRVDDQLEHVTVRFLSENTDLSPLQAQQLIREHGDDREKLMKIASTMKAEG